jgi:signal transduction histidine kinase
VERGTVEVAYVEAKPSADEGPFLREERALITSVAREVSTLVERRMIEEERVRLQEQLRHADRLATIGQMAAGVVHELNEPLASILGFAQLCRKHPNLPAPAAADLDKIVGATLHAREVVKKLMFFARERPPVHERVEPAQIIEEGVAFVEARAKKAGIRSPTVGLTDRYSATQQLIQVIVNLAVNAIRHAQGGRLTVGASAEGTLRWWRTTAMACRPRCWSASSSSSPPRGRWGTGLAWRCTDRHCPRRHHRAG